MQLSQLLPEQNHNFLEDKANELLRYFNVKNIEDINIERFASHIPKILLCYMDQRSKTVINKEFSVLIIDKRLDAMTQRIQLAEEFCHSFLHIGNQCSYKGSWMLDKQENQAKRMAAYLLCPLYLLKEIEIPYDTYFYINNLANIFNVTPDFMKYRLSLIWGQDLDVIAYINGLHYGYASLE